MGGKCLNILLVEDNPGDVHLTKEAFAADQLNCNFYAVSDGEQAMSFLNKKDQYAEAPTPDMIFLDLNLPKKDGREVLVEIKNDGDLKIIPVIILTTSQADEDLNFAYENYANCYIRKPVDMDQFMEVAKKIGAYWSTIVKLPNH